MDTIYLVFPNQQTAIDALTASGYEMDEYNAHCSGNGWGPVLAGSVGIECNLYDCNSLHESLQQYVVPAPLTPSNVRAGEEVAAVFRTVIVADAIRDTCLAMVVAMAGPTHAGMWSTKLIRESDGTVFWVNSGPVRVELAAMLADAATLAAGTGITVEQAAAILSQCVVSDADPLAVMAEQGLVAI